MVAYFCYVPVLEVSFLYKSGEVVVECYLYPEDSTCGYWARSGGGDPAAPCGEWAQGGGGGKWGIDGGGVGDCGVYVVRSAEIYDVLSVRVSGSGGKKEGNGVGVCGG